MTYQPNNLSGANVKGFVFFANRKAARIVFFCGNIPTLEQQLCTHLPTSEHPVSADSRKIVSETVYLKIGERKTSVTTQLKYLEIFFEN